ncbi:MAG TPA: sugar ABC transporter substrate-binding protein [Vicinamibacterales bacterium]|nr:sugar ABC transporter substrate-binding protein [Vicinamibacterales bacterium]
MVWRRSARTIRKREASTRSRRFERRLTRRTFFLPVGTVLIAVALGGVHAACNRPATDAGTPGRGRIAFVMKTLNHPFFLDMKRGAEEAANRLGLDLVVQAAERELDVEKQTQIIENLIQTGVKALCVTPSGSKEVVSVLAKATRAGIPIVIADTRVDPDAAAAANVKLGTFVGSDNYEGGRLAGEFLLQSTDGRARVAILEGIPGHETGDSRLRGFRDAVARAPGVTIVASQPANWERDQGFTVFQNMLQAHPDIDALFAANDLMALGAVEAIAATNRTGKVRVIGFDALDDARAAIEAGRMAASVAQSPRDMGRLAVESADRLIRGETVPADQTVPIVLVTKTSTEGR